jgi:hypothetical protein
MVIFCGNLPQYFNPRKSRVKITMVIYTVLFYNIGPKLQIFVGIAGKMCIRKTRFFGFAENASQFS